MFEVPDNPCQFHVIWFNGQVPAPTVTEYVCDCVAIADEGLGVSMVGSPNSDTLIVLLEDADLP